MENHKFNSLLVDVEMKLTKKQRFELFEHLYLTYSFNDMVKIERRILKEISTVDEEMVSNKVVKDVKAACKTILKSYKHL